MSGEIEYFESNQIEVRIPLSILKDRNGNPADYFEMSLPRDDEEGLDDDNVFVYRIDEETNEIVVYNRLPCPAAQHGYFEISYSTNKRTYDYQDYDPDGETPGDRNPSADFQVTLTISRDGETHSETSDPIFGSEAQKRHRLRMPQKGTAPELAVLHRRHEREKRTFRKTVFHKHERS